MLLPYYLRPYLRRSTSHCFDHRWNFNQWGSLSLIIAIVTRVHFRVVNFLLLLNRLSQCILFGRVIRFENVLCWAIVILGRIPRISLSRSVSFASHMWGYPDF